MNRYKVKPENDLTFLPILILRSICKNDKIDDMVQRMKCANIFVLSEKVPFELFKHFGFQSGRDVDKFAGFKDYKLAVNGIPYISKGVDAFFSIDIKQAVDLIRFLLENPRR